jgi:hypothetical protein
VSRIVTFWPTHRDTELRQFVGTDHLAQGVTVDEGVDRYAPLVRAVRMPANLGIVRVISVPRLNYDHRLSLLSLLV